MSSEVRLFILVNTIKLQIMRARRLSSSVHVLQVIRTVDIVACFAESANEGHDISADYYDHGVGQNNRTLLTV